MTLWLGCRHRVRARRLIAENKAIATTKDYTKRIGEGGQEGQCGIHTLLLFIGGAVVAADESCWKSFTFFFD